MLCRSSAWIIRDPHIFHIVNAATDRVTVHRSRLASGGAPRASARCSLVSAGHQFNHRQPNR